MSLPLLPDRDCGGCVECCRHIPLDLPELSKPTGSLCAYCVDGAGCSVYAIRPETCRTWFCIWRMVELSDEWRPDRSGIIVRPDGLTTGEITLYVVRETSFLWSIDFFDTLAVWLENGLTIALSISGPIGMLPTRAVVSDYLRPALERRDHRMFCLMFRMSLDRLACHDWQPDEIVTCYAVQPGL